MFFTGREYRAIFVCTSEPVNPDGSSANSTKSVCDKFVFNTVITRAQSLVVAVGNPYRLFKIEKMSPNGRGCWKEYVRHCLDKQSVSGANGHLRALRRLVHIVAVVSSGDDILEEYRDAETGTRLAIKNRKHTIPDAAGQRQTSYQSSPQPDLIKDVRRAAQISKDCQNVRAYAVKQIYICI